MGPVVYLFRSTEGWWLTQWLDSGFRVVFSGKTIYSHSRSLYLEISKTSTGEFSHFWCDVDDDHGPADNDDNDK